MTVKATPKRQPPKNKSVIAKAMRDKGPFGAPFFMGGRVT